LIWTLGTCISMQLLFAVPYAQNERSLNSTAIRGMLIGIPVAYFEAGLFMTEIAILVRGEFHWRFVLSIPISVCCALAFAFVPVREALLGLCSVAFLAPAATYLLCLPIMVAPLQPTEEQKTLYDRFGPVMGFGSAAFSGGVIGALCIFESLPCCASKLGIHRVHLRDESLLKPRGWRDTTAAVDGDGDGLHGGVQALTGETVLRAQGTVHPSIGVACWRTQQRSPAPSADARRHRDGIRREHRNQRTPHRQHQIRLDPC
jgi:hypothetical protein